MRARNIKPGFFTNDDLGSMNAYARLLFIGLWCLADREGRLQDRPRRIKVEVFPYEDVDVVDLLVQLAAAGFILRYVADGGACIQIVNFLKHQAPHYRETASVLPAMEGWLDSIRTYGDVSDEDRQAVFMRDGHRCLRCGATENLSIDHIVPRSKGGFHDPENLQTLCLRCNTSKNARSSSDHRAMNHQGSGNASAPLPSDSLIPDSLIPDPGFGGGASTREETPPTTADAGAIAATAEVLSGARFVGDDLETVTEAVVRSLALVPGFRARDGPVVATAFARYRPYRKQPPEDWYVTWLKWLRKEVTDEAARSPNGRSDPDRGEAGRAAQAERDKALVRRVGGIVTGERDG